MWERDERWRAVKGAETALLTGGTRRDTVELERLLHSDFIEIGCSGRYWTRHETILSLQGEAVRATPESDEWRFNEIVPGLVLVTYRLSAGGIISRRSSIWDCRAETPQLLFHQGTIVPEADIADGAHEDA